MKTYVFNGERWHLDDRPMWCRMRRWLFCAGLRELKNGRLASEGELTPFSVLGHRATFFGHWFQVRTPAGWLVVRFSRDPAGNIVRRGLLGFPEIEHAYISVNGTPQNAHTWLVGCPVDIVRHVATRAVA